MIKKIGKKINSRIIIIIFIAFLKLWYYRTIFFPICQQKLHDKICQITTDVIIPTASAIKDATNTNRIFFIPTQLVYTAIVYSVVSVEPIIVEAIIPIKLSTPY